MNHKETSINQVKEFMTVGKQLINLTPTLVDNKLANFRADLIFEEAKELQQALAESNIVEVLDALCDLQYVLDGAFHTFGMGSIKDVSIEEVHKSNMSKFCTTEEEAQLTVEDYSEKGIETYYKQVEVKNDNLAVTFIYYVVYRKSDDKVMKSINYKPVTEKLKEILKVQ